MLMWCIFVCIKAGSAAQTVLPWFSRAAASHQTLVCGEWGAGIAAPLSFLLSSCLEEVTHVPQSFSLSWQSLSLQDFVFVLIEVEFKTEVCSFSSSRSRTV